MIEQEIKIDSETTIRRIELENHSVIYYIVDEINGSVYDLYKISTPFVEDKNNEVICYYNGYELVLNKKTTLLELVQQYKQAQESEKFSNDFNKGLELQNIVDNMNLKNAKASLKKVSKILSEADISKYQLSSLSKNLLNIYKSTKEDPFLDYMVEEAKVLAKENKNI